MSIYVYHLHLSVCLDNTLGCHHLYPILMRENRLRYMDSTLGVVNAYDKIVHKNQSIKTVVVTMYRWLQLLHLRMGKFCKYHYRSVKTFISSSLNLTIFIVVSHAGHIGTLIISSGNIYIMILC